MQVEMFLYTLCYLVTMLCNDKITFLELCTVTCEAFLCFLSATLKKRLKISKSIENKINESLKDLVFRVADKKQRKAS